MSSARQNARNDRRHRSLPFPSPVPTSPVSAQRSAHALRPPQGPNLLSLVIPGWFPKEGPQPFLWSFQGGSGREIRNPRGAPSRRPQAAEHLPPSPPPQRRAQRRERHTEKAGASPPGAPGAGAPAALSGPGGSRARSGAAAERRPWPPPPQGATDGVETAPPHGTRGAGPQPPGRASSNRRARPPQGPDDCDEEPGADAHGCEHSFEPPKLSGAGLTGAPPIWPAHPARGSRGTRLPRRGPRGIRRRPAPRRRAESLRTPASGSHGPRRGISSRG